MITESTFSRNFREKLLPAWNMHPRYLDSCGGARSGKTYSILQMLVLKALAEAADGSPAKITSVVSETLPHLKRGAIRDFKSIMQSWEIWNDRQWNRTDNIFTFSNGGMIEFFSADSPGKVHGPARDRLFINEAQNVDYETARQLFIRTRDRIIIDYNPVREFWVHENIQGRPECVSIHSTYKDNEFLTPEQVAEIESNKGSGNWWRVYGEGKIGQAEGVIFDFTQIESMPESSDMVETYGIDFGFTNDPTVIVHVKVHTGRKEIYVDQLEYRTGMLNRDIIRTLDAYHVPKRAIPIFADAAEPKSIAEIAQAGFNCKPSYKATRKAEQIAFMQQYKLFITKRSVEGIKETRNYCWAKDKDGRPLNEPQAFADHFMDAMRYASYSPFADFRKSGHYKIINR